MKNIIGKRKMILMLSLIAVIFIATMMIGSKEVKAYGAGDLCDYCRIGTLYLNSKTSKPATCSEEGRKEYWCNYCNQFNCAEPIPKVAHDFPVTYTELKVGDKYRYPDNGEEFTVNFTGHHAKICKKCKAVENILQHTESKDLKKSWKVSDDKKKHQQICKDCDGIYREHPIDTKNQSWMKQDKNGKASETEHAIYCAHSNCQGSNPVETHTATPGEWKETIQGGSTQYATLLHENICTVCKSLPAKTAHAITVGSDNKIRVYEKYHDVMKECSICQKHIKEGKKFIDTSTGKEVNDKIKCTHADLSDWKAGNEHYRNCNICGEPKIQKHNAGKGGKDCVICNVHEHEWEWYLDGITGIVHCKKCSLCGEFGGWHGIGKGKEAGCTICDPDSGGGNNGGGSNGGGSNGGGSNGGGSNGGGSNGGGSTGDGNTAGDGNTDGGGDTNGPTQYNGTITIDCNPKTQILKPGPVTVTIEYTTDAPTTQDVRVYYSINGGSLQLYTGPFEVTDNCVITAQIINMTNGQQIGSTATLNITNMIEANITLSAIPEGPTTGKVTVTAIHKTTAKNTKNQYSLNGTTWQDMTGTTTQKIENGVTWNVFTGTVEVSQNGTVYTRIIEGANEFAKESITITNMIPEEEVPGMTDKITFAKNPESDLADSVNVKITYETEKDGAKKEYKLNDEEWKTYPGGNGLDITENNSIVRARLVDKNGNVVLEEMIKITNVKEAKISFERRPLIAAASEVKLIIVYTTNIPNTVLEYKVGKEDWKVASSSTMELDIKQNNTRVTARIRHNTDGVLKEESIVIDTTGKYRIEAGTTIAQFINEYEIEEDYEVYTKEGEKVNSDVTRLGTGMVLKIEDREYSIIVVGDLTGNGTVDVTDVAKLKRHTLELELLVNEYLEAADINEDGQVNVVDLSRMKLMILGIKV